MRHSALPLALAASLALAGSSADAGPARHGGRHGKVKKGTHRPRVAPPAETADEIEMEPQDIDAPVMDKDPARVRVRATKRKTARIEIDEDDEGARVAFVSPEIDDDADGGDTIDAPVKVRKATAARTQDWHVAIGPYLWASSVKADVSLGPSTVGAGVDFIDLQRHAKYGAEVIAEVRHGRFSITGDLMYGVVAVTGQREVGPLMVTVDGTASSLLVDGAAGYMIAGGDHALLSLEARAGIRYQRTAITGSVGVGGNTVAPPATVDAASDAVAGARVFVRPLRRLYFASTLDIGVVGKSTNTWSASADASIRFHRRVLFSLGYRMLTTERANVSIVMHGPRAALQLLF